MDDYRRRSNAISLLMREGESRLEAFFFSLGLAQEFTGPAAGWGRQKRIVAALAAAERRGDLEGVLDLIQQEFGGKESAAEGAAAPLGSEPHVAEPRPTLASGASGPSTVDDTVTSVFLVHGHDEFRRELVARLIERIGNGRLEAIILVEHPNQGMTLIEKFEQYARTAGFAVVLLTPDDLVEVSAPHDSRARARQNVILELGYFVGTLGRNRIAVLLQGDVEIPSDIHGVVYIQMDDAGAWKHALAREMSSAGLPVDFSKIV